jgi:hypothetical protein
MSESVDVNGFLHQHTCLDTKHRGLGLVEIGPEDFYLRIFSSINWTDDRSIIGVGLHCGPGL